MARTVVRAKQTESKYERSEEVRSSSDVPSGDIDELRSRGLREEVKDVCSGPVLILRDSRPGVSNEFSYDQEGKIMQVVDGEGASPNPYVLKLLHIKSEKVDELWVTLIDYCGSDDDTYSIHYMKI